MLRLLHICVFAFGLQMSQAFANATPNHVYQVTERSIALLEMLNQANFSTPNYPDTEVKPALPRHVLQMSRDVWRKTQLLRFMNGLPTQTLAPVPARTITPSDVKETVDEIYLQLEGVLPAYGLTGGPPETSLPSDKTPTDVFVNLLRMSAALDSLGVPATVPNDVHQIAETVLQDALRLAEMAKVPNGQEVAEDVAPVTGKSPRDAYQSTLSLLEDLQLLVETDSDIAIKGGVEISQSPEQVSPSDVIIVLLRSRAEVNAMRVALGDTSPSNNAVYQGGKTPSDVVTTVLRAQAVIQHITDNRSG